METKDLDILLKEIEKAIEGRDKRRYDALCVSFVREYNLRVSYYSDVIKKAEKEQIEFIRNYLDKFYSICKKE